MVTELPPCSQFVIAAIRQLRRNSHRPENRVVGIGLSIHRLFEIVETSPYTDEAYRNAMAELFSNGEILITAYKAQFGGDSGRFAEVILRPGDIPDWFDFRTSEFETDFEGGRIARPDTEGETHTEYIRILRRWRQDTNHIEYGTMYVYVASDTLPDKIERLRELADPKAKLREKSAAILDSING